MLYIVTVKTNEEPIVTRTLKVKANSKKEAKQCVDRLIADIYNEIALSYIIIEGRK